VIPYTLDSRSDTGVSNTTLGIWLFIASEVMLFGALFSAYALLRVSAETWPHGRATLNLPLGALNTAILLGLTATMWSARTRPLAPARRRVVAATVLAMTFLIVKALEYRGEIALGMLPSVSTFLATYFTLTGLHAAHVIGGAIANAWVLAGRAGEAMTMNRMRLLSLYWTLVDGVWIVIFLLVYLS
jgi:heme/copper-type cytochrome/quinol oxidase subunit 3